MKYQSLPLFEFQTSVILISNRAGCKGHMLVLDLKKYTCTSYLQDSIIILTNLMSKRLKKKKKKKRKEMKTKDLKSKFFAGQDQMHEGI